MNLNKFLLICYKVIIKIKLKTINSDAVNLTIDQETPKQKTELCKKSLNHTIS